ncbi:hypothetical protein ABZ608_41475 [Streptomyces sp. NPDC013172]|uniref:Uncharacterized protein n=1 Tax=Streptomyces atriruber TaxID=545121 RepID=A0ABV3C1T9_9ACTN
MAEPKLTLREKAAIVRLELKGIRRAAAGITHQPGLDREVEAIYRKARAREAKNK